MTTTDLLRAVRNTMTSGAPIRMRRISSDLAVLLATRNPTPTVAAARASPTFQSEFQSVFLRGSLAARLGNCAGGVLLSCCSDKWRRARPCAARPRGGGQRSILNPASHYLTPAPISPYGRLAVVNAEDALHYFLRFLFWWSFNDILFHRNSLSSCTYMRAFNVLVNIQDLHASIRNSTPRLPKPHAPSPVTTLPPEVILHIFTYLRYRDTHRMALLRAGSVGPCADRAQEDRRERAAADLRACTLTCKAWRAPVTDVLYRDLRPRDERTWDLLARTLVGHMADHKWCPDTSTIGLASRVSRIDAPPVMRNSRPGLIHDVVRACEMAQHVGGCLVRFSHWEDLSPPVRWTTDAKCATFRSQHFTREDNIRTTVVSFAGQLHDPLFLGDEPDRDALYQDVEHCALFFQREMVQPHGAAPNVISLLLFDVSVIRDDVRVWQGRPGDFQALPPGRAMLQDLTVDVEALLGDCLNYEKLSNVRSLRVVWRLQLPTKPDVLKMPGLYIESKMQDNWKRNQLNCKTFVCLQANVALVADFVGLATLRGQPPRCEAPDFSLMKTSQTFVEEQGGR
ncbi:hypothetical protein BKA62DRAFT_760172 [Auriculariales sp. MPI-PUGE-AT-0066]|nr:hypothetical protein BKA62DRAFT_760172 [Auriculariales sp. MPI-PUGE-AT-0066]